MEYDTNNAVSERKQTSLKGAQNLGHIGYKLQYGVLRRSQQHFQKYPQNTYGAYNHLFDDEET